MTDEPEAPEASPDIHVPVVDFMVLGRRLRRTGLVLGCLIVIAWAVAIPWRGADGRLFMNLVGLGLGLMFVAEVVIVGGSALRGMLRAGERGDRLASTGVGVLPPPPSPLQAVRCSVGY